VGHPQGHSWVHFSCCCRCSRGPAAAVSATAEVGSPTAGAQISTTAAAAWPSGSGFPIIIVVAASVGSLLLLGIVAAVIILRRRRTLGQRSPQKVSADGGAAGGSSSGAISGTNPMRSARGLLAVRTLPPRSTPSSSSRRALGGRSPRGCGRARPLGRSSRGAAALSAPCWEGLLPALLATLLSGAMHDNPMRSGGVRPSTAVASPPGSNPGGGRLYPKLGAAGVGAAPGAAPPRSYRRCRRHVNDIQSHDERARAPTAAAEGRIACCRRGGCRWSKHGFLRRPRCRPRRSTSGQVIKRWSGCGDES